jgi:site-specific DNA-methyltransferase (adenine-specific)
MKLYSENKDYKLYQGNMLDMLEVIEPNSIDSIITDPPYGLTSITKRFGKEDSAECQYGKDGSFQRLSKGFMGKEWDGSGIEYNIETWKKCYEVLKPGGYLLAFRGSRTFHRIACAIEDAGFEIRDTIMWLYGSGFPKSMSLSKGLEAREKLGNAGTRNKRKIEQACDTEEYTLKQTNNGAMGELIETTRKQYIPDTDLAKQWNGWGTALKPSFEPIIVARKPFKSSLVDNVIEYGVGGINIDECRVEFSNNEPDNRVGKIDVQKGAMKNPWGAKSDYDNTTYKNNGRFPANTILTYDETDFDEVCGGFPYTKSGGGDKSTKCGNTFLGTGYGGTNTNKYEANEGSTSRYFYCAKASKKDRDEGLDEFEEKKGIRSNAPRKNEEIKTKPRKNTHPTVKPTDLMQYLVRLVTPNGGTILDPFNGSGSTGKAVMYENKERNKGYKYIGIELTEEYLPIAKARIEYVCKLNEEELKEMQMTIFDILEE